MRDLAMWAAGGSRHRRGGGSRRPRRDACLRQGADRAGLDEAAAAPRLAVRRARLARRRRPPRRRAGPWVARRRGSGSRSSAPPSTALPRPRTRGRPAAGISAGWCSPPRPCWRSPARSRRGLDLTFSGAGNSAPGARHPPAAPGLARWHCQRAGGAGRQGPALNFYRMPAHLASRAAFSRPRSSNSCRRSGLRNWTWPVRAFGPAQVRRAGLLPIRFQPRWAAPP